MKFNFLLEDSGYWSISIRKGYNWFLTDMHRYIQSFHLEYTLSTPLDLAFFFFSTSTLSEAIQMPLLLKQLISSLYILMFVLPRISQFEEALSCLLVV